MANQNQDRSQLRHNLLHLRHHLNIHEQQIAAQKITAEICASNIFLSSQNIACYLAAKGEVDVAPLIQQIWLLQKKCYLPVLDPQEKRLLNFMPYDEHTQLIKNKYNILEPIYDKTKIIAPQNLDLVIVPLVGFDSSGNRLGQGGGFYDYTFSFKLGTNDLSKQTEKPYLLGVAYAWQKLTTKLVAQAWDVRLNAVVTEDNWYGF